MVKFRVSPGKIYFSRDIFDLSNKTFLINFDTSIKNVFSPTKVHYSFCKRLDASKLKNLNSF